jgi:hypothetical protein
VRSLSSNQKTKMKQSLLAFLLLLGGRAAACDVCGASGSNQSMGLLSFYNSHFIGIQYQYRNFTSTHPTEPGESNSGTSGAEYYKTIQLWGKVNISRYIQLFAFVPYQQNTQHESGAVNNYSGLGDVSLLAGSYILKTKADKAVTHALFIAAGVKAPTGTRSVADGTTGDGLLNVQPGTGSWDALLNANYSASYKNTGINTEASYTITTPNNAQYKYGNRLSAGWMVFHRFNKNNLSIVPQLGIRFDYTLHDYDNYERKWLNEQTGGLLSYGVASVQAYYKQIGFQASYYLPAWQNYAQGYVTAQRRADLGLLFLFK